MAFASGVLSLKCVRIFGTNANQLFIVIVNVPKASEQISRQIPSRYRIAANGQGGGMLN